MNQNGSQAIGLQNNGSHSNGSPHSGYPNPRLDMAQARDAVLLDDSGKWDTYVSRSDVTMKEGQLEFPLDQWGEVRERAGLSRWATGQLCARLGMPAAYFRQCPPALQDQNANYWLREGAARQGRSLAENGSRNGEEKWLLRARYGTLRAVLSEHYSPLDNMALLDSLLPLVDRRYQLDWLGLCDEGLHLRIIDPTRPREVLPNDPLSAGVHIANSEVGMRSVTVDALVYRLVCKNGLIALVKGKSLLRQRHIHLAQPRFVAALEEALVQALATANDFLEQMAHTTQEVVPDPEEAIRQLGLRWHLSEETQDAAKVALLGEDEAVQHTAYGLINALTNAAQRLPDERRYDLEVLAGQLAQHGVPKFALASAEKSVAVLQDVKPRRAPKLSEDSLPDDSSNENSSNEKSISESSIVEFAREMFEAEIIGRQVVMS